MGLAATTSSQLQPFELSKLRASDIYRPAPALPVACVAKIPTTYVTGGRGNIVSYVHVCTSVHHRPAGRVPMKDRRIHLIDAWTGGSIGHIIGRNSYACFPCIYRKQQQVQFCWCPPVRQPSITGASLPPVPMCSANGTGSTSCTVCITILIYNKYICVNVWQRRNVGNFKNDLTTVDDPHVKIKMLGDMIHASMHACICGLNHSTRDDR